MHEQSFRPSRLKALALAALCFGAWLVTRHLLAGTALMSALEQGGLTGKLALANIVFGLLAPFAVVKAIAQPAKLTVDADGVVETTMFGRFDCRWQEVQGIDVVTLYGNATVRIHTAGQVKTLLPGYGPSPRKLAALLEQYRQAAQPQLV